VLSAFRRASQISDRVGLLLYRAEDVEIEQAKHLFTFKLHQKWYLNVHDAQLRINELGYAGCKVIVSSPMVTEIVQRSGLQAVLVYSEHAVRRALDDAFSLCQAERVEAIKRLRLDSILHHLRGGEKAFKKILPCH
jgi:propionate catabolism operon transcriptional regulator